MPFLFTMPKLSPTMEEGTIAKWLKKEGDYVEAGELIVEIATDKATVEHAALDEGYLRQILIKEGQGAIVNQPIALFSATKDENIENALPKKEVKKEAPAKTNEKVPTPAVSGAERREPLFVPEKPLEDYSLDSFRDKERLKASPLAKKLAEEKGLDLTTVKGTGPHGRITSEDLKGAGPKALVSFGRKEPPQDLPGSYEEVPLTHLRKIIGKRLQDSKSFIPHFYVRQTVEVSALWNLYEQLKALKLKVTINDLLIRATALALVQHPELNCGFNSQTQSIIRFKTIDIAVAVSMPDGLITPIIRLADYKNVGEISTEIRALAERGRQGKLKEHEYKGGSFSISNLGMYGTTEFAAVINPPQAAILAVGGVEDKPVVKDGAIVPGKTLHLTLSVDHRVIDGAVAAQFLKTLKILLEQPIGLTI